MTKHVAGFSGGIDSQALCDLLLATHGKEHVIILNSQAGRNEHPITAEHVKWYSDNIHPVIEVVPLILDLGNRGTKPGKTRDRRQEYADTDEMTFPDLAYIKGRFPSRKAQFCTQHLKLEPQKRWSDENLIAKGIDFIRYSGVRRDESDTRKDAAEVEWDDFFDCELRRPLATWTKQECFSYVQARSGKINPLYTMGFERVGCAPCVNAKKDDIREWATRAPEMIDKVRDWEKEVGRTFFAPMVPGLEINWVDECVAWSKTAHGGKITLLPFHEADAEKGRCVSKYGLCE